MAKKFDEYNRGRIQGLDMAYRMLRDEGMKEASEVIADEIRKRGKIPVALPVTSKEVEHGIAQMKECMYETFTYMALDVLYCRFDFGKVRGMRFLKWWNIKTECLEEGLETWQEKVDDIKGRLGYDISTVAMQREGWVK